VFDKLNDKQSLTIVKITSVISYLLMFAFIITKNILLCFCTITFLIIVLFTLRPEHVNKN